MLTWDTFPNKVQTSGNAFFLTRFLMSYWCFEDTALSEITHLALMPKLVPGVICLLRNPEGLGKESSHHNYSHLRCLVFGVQGPTHGNKFILARKSLRKEYFRCQGTQRESPIFECQVLEFYVFANTTTLVRVLLSTMHHC